MGYVIAWIIFWTLIGIWNGRRKGHMFWMILTFLISGPVGFMIWATTPVRAEYLTKQQAERARYRGEKVCPFCAERIKSAAIVCIHCGRDISRGTT